MEINTVQQFEEHLKNPYAWPGGYTKIFICSDGGVLCHKCATDEKDEIIEAIQDNRDEGWRVVAVDILLGEEDETCDHCGETII
jgi:hypothetical protein